MYPVEKEWRIVVCDKNYKNINGQQTELIDGNLTHSKFEQNN